MARFIYKAKNSRGEIATGTVRANNESEAEKVLTKHGLVPTELYPERKPLKLALFPHRIGAQDRAVFSRQLATMISAGLSLPKAISIIAKQQSNDHLKNVFLDIYNDLQEGYNFSSALSKHPEAFDRVYVSVVSSGEATGKLDIVLDQLADQLEDDSNFVSKVKTSLYYPAFVLVALIGIGIFMLAFVIPKLKDLFSQAGEQLPIMTRILLALSDFIQNYWWVLILVVVGLVLFFKYWLATDSGQRSMSTIQLSIPGLKNVFQGLHMFRFTRTLSMLIGAGVPLLDALRISGSVINNLQYEESIANIAKQVEKGVPLSVQLIKEPIFPQLIGQMAAVGEETGELDKVLSKVADYYERATSDLTTSISSLIEPAVLLIVGAGVAFMVFAIYIPIYQISSAVK